MSKFPVWIITSLPKHKIDIDANFYIKEGNGFVFFSESKLDNNSSRIWLCNGLVLPRLNEKIDESISSNQTQLIEWVYKKYGEDFIHHIKGNFIIVRLEQDTFSVYTDRMGIIKYFYWQNKNSFILSNSIHPIIQAINPPVSNESIAVYTLTYHFIGGITLFEGVHYSKPSEIASFKGSTFKFQNYWDPINLTKGVNSYSKRKITEILVAVFKQYAEKCKPSKASLSLTAGADSRLMLSILERLGIELHTYTYGQSNSIDCTIAARIAKKIGVQHSIYNFPVTRELFKQFALISVASGQTLCSLHRAHRVYAIAKESQHSANMFLGTMGGEFVKGAGRDEYIVSDFLYEFSKAKDPETIIRHLKSRGFNTAILNIEWLTEFFKTQRWCKSDTMDLYILVDIIASNHHAQNDINYREYLNQILTPFIDIDYLEVLFQSRYNFYTARRNKCSFLRRLRNHMFSSAMQSHFNYKLARIPYNSGFKASEYRASPLLALVLARIRKRRFKSISNFPLGQWMKEFVCDELVEMKGNEFLSNVFNLNEMLNELNEKKLKTNEAFWVKYTSPIQMKFLLQNFK